MEGALMTLKLILLVAAAGALGSTLRYLINLLFLRGGVTGLPYATLTVNVLGCFLAGLLFGLFATKFAKYANYAPVLMVGFLGAFTTFSTFALESVTLLAGGAIWKGLLNIALQNLAGLGAISAGLGLVRQICR